MKQIPVLLISVLLATMLSCDKDPVIPNEEELITTVTYTLSPQGGGDDVVLFFEDLDGDGGDDPTFRVDSLLANTTYTGVLLLESTVDGVTENISDEVAVEANEHQFFFASSLADLTVSYADTDSDGNPIGLVSVLTTGAAGTGTLTVTLRHEPNKSASGVADGDLTNAGGETDIEVEFAVVVE